ncbi:hypothetical protein [Ornithinimicrobium sufpigmenti]|uniref:hypothetical protein n=1 Tax=Ornithinimicrobium sufpigmenti TaxID=2508882 RepID=UPI001035B442|nr:MULTISPECIES: hypothetical protein [unclassified Ornithinimicrobium]
MTSFQPDRYPASFDPRQEDIPAPLLRSLNIMVAAMATALVALGVVLAVIGGELVTPDLWMLALVALATVGAWGLVLVLPVRLPRSNGGDVRGGPGSPHGATVEAAVMVRVAVLEAPALLGIALAFLSHPVNLLVYAVPAAFSLLGIWLFARPRVVLERLSRGA